MTIIYEQGKYHIEVHDVIITISDAAEDYAGALTPLDRAGNVVSVSAINAASFGGTNTNMQAVGAWSFLDASFGSYTIGEYLENFRMTVHKVAGTSGDTVLHFIVTLHVRSQS